METISRPLLLSLKENREMLAEGERLAVKELARNGSPEGNRRQRRLAAKRERQVLRRPKAFA